jgi:hypothetical protein
VPPFEQWQLEVNRGYPVYLHTHKCVDHCGYNCNNKRGFLLAQLIAVRNQPPKELTLLPKTTLTTAEIPRKLRTRMLAAMATLAVRLLRRLARLLTM